MNDSSGKRYAIMFDMDGVIVDTEPVHLEAMILVLAARGHSLSEGLFRTFVGRRSDECYEQLRRQFQLEEPVLHLISEHDAHYGRLLQQKLGEGSLLPTPGVVNLLKGLKVAGLARGLVSGSPRWQVDNILEYLHLKAHFQGTVAGNEVIQGKPDPEGFLRCARWIGVPPENCVAIEDSPHGITSARRASMKAVAILSRYISQSAYRDADLIVSSFEELSPERLLRLLPQDC